MTRNRETHRDGVELIRAVPVRHPGRWVAAVAIVLIVAWLAIIIIGNPNFYWDTFWKYFRDVKVVNAVGQTLLLTVLSMVLAIVLAIVLSFMRLSDNPVLRWSSWVWIWFFRGTPVYTQLIFWGLISLVLPKIVVGVPFGPEFFSWNTQDIITTFWAAVLGLGLNESAYLAEIFRAGLRSVDKGQVEAAEALGMRKNKINMRIVLPQAMRVIIPPTGNETISMLKTTSLVVAIPYTLELTFVTNAFGNTFFQPLPFLMIAAVWYLIITSILMVGQYYLERYFGRGIDNLSPTPVNNPPLSAQRSTQTAA